jgi:hypothetical protein
MGAAVGAEGKGSPGEKTQELGGSPDSRGNPVRLSRGNS